jgi:hypothetical protein
MYATGGPAQRSVRFEWLGESWQVFSAQAGIWVVSALIYGVITFIVVYGLELALILPTIFSSVGGPGGAPPDPTALARSIMPRAYLVGVGLALAMVAINAFFWGGLLKMANKQVRGFPLSVGDLFKGGSAFLRLFGYQLIFYIPLLILGFAITYPMTMRAYSALATSPYDPFAQMRAMMPVYAIALALDIVPIILFGLFWPAAALIADGEPLLAALGKSWNAMKGSWLLASVFMLVFFIILGVTAPFCLLPLLATIPMFMIISTLMYRDMIGMPPGQAPPVRDICSRLLGHGRRHHHKLLKTILRRGRMACKAIRAGKRAFPCEKQLSGTTPSIPGVGPLPEQRPFPCIRMTILHRPR